MVNADAAPVAEVPDNMGFQTCLTLPGKLILRHCEEQLVRRSSTSEGGSDEAIHSSSWGLWIASRSLSSGAHSRDPLARNDGGESLTPRRRPERSARTAPSARR